MDSCIFFTCKDIHDLREYKDKIAPDMYIDDFIMDCVRKVVNKEV